MADGSLFCEDSTDHRGRGHECYQRTGAVGNEIVYIARAPYHVNALDKFCNPAHSYRHSEGSNPEGVRKGAALPHAVKHQGRCNASEHYGMYKFVGAGEKRYAFSWDRIGETCEVEHGDYHNGRRQPRREISDEFYHYPRE